MPDPAPPIPRTWPASAEAKAGDWRELSRKAVEATGGRAGATGLGTDAGTALRREVEFYRGKARLAINKLSEWKDAEVAAFKARYFINTDIFTSRALAEQSAADIFKHAGEDALPGVTPARLTPRLPSSPRTKLLKATRATPKAPPPGSASSATPPSPKSSASATKSNSPPKPPGPGAATTTSRCAASSCCRRGGRSRGSL